MKKLSLDEISEQRLKAEEARHARRYPIYVLLDNVRSLYNVGSIFRTADAARIGKLYLCGITGKPPRKEIDKTALGAVETVPWEHHPDAVELIRRLKSEGMHIIALEHTSESISHWEYSYPWPSCLVIGHEVWGIQDEVLALADSALEIPMFGAKHSLNASVAFGIAVYDMLYKYRCSTRR